MIPNEALKDNFKKSADSYKNVAPYHFYNGEKWNGIADNYADIILLNVAWHMGKGNPMAASIDTGYYDGGDGGTQRVDVGRALVGLFLYMGILGSVWYLFHKKEGKREASILLLLLGAVVFLRYRPFSLWNTKTGQSCLRDFPSIRRKLIDSYREHIR